MFENLFAKRTVIFKKRDRETWKQIRAALKEAGLRGMRAGHYFQEAVMVAGYGANVDARDFGPNGKIDRDIYWVEVVEGDEEKARAILTERGIKAVVEDNILLDAALRKSRLDKYYPNG